MYSDALLSLFYNNFVNMTEKKGLLSNNTEAEYFSDFTPNSNKSLTWHNIN